jgi:hypothetical protein
MIGAAGRLAFSDDISRDLELMEYGLDPSLDSPLLPNAAVMNALQNLPAPTGTFTSASAESPTTTESPSLWRTTARASPPKTGRKSWSRWCGFTVKATAPAQAWASPLAPASPKPMAESSLFQKPREAEPPLRSASPPESSARQRLRSRAFPVLLEGHSLLLLRDPRRPGFMRRLGCCGDDGTTEQRLCRPGHCTPAITLWSIPERFGG